MAKKKIVVENGKTYTMKEKKPFYKKAWFWIVIVLIGAYALSGGEEEPKAENVGASQESSDVAEKEEIKKEDKKEEPEIFVIGDTVSLDGYEIKVNTVNFSDGEEWSTPDDGKQYVIINLTIANNTDEKVSFNPLDFSLNVDGVSQTTGFDFVSGIDTLSSGDLDPGASVTGNIIGQAAPETNLKLRYEGNMFLKNEEIDIVLR